MIDQTKLLYPSLQFTARIGAFSYWKLKIFRGVSFEQGIYEYSWNNFLVKPVIQDKVKIIESSIILSFDINLAIPYNDNNKWRMVASDITRWQNNRVVRESIVQYGPPQPCYKLHEIICFYFNLRKISIKDLLLIIDFDTKVTLETIKC